MVKVLFVCTGNICRSPTAEAVFRHMAKQANLDSAVLADSAGTHGYYHQAPSDERAQAVARRHGVDMSTLRSRTVYDSDFTIFDFILAMDRGHERDLKRRSPAASHNRIHMFLSFAPRFGREVPDPWYGDISDFESAYTMIEAGCAGLLDHIRRTILHRT